MYSILSLENALTDADAEPQLEEIKKIKSFIIKLEGLLNG